MWAVRLGGRPGSSAITHPHLPHYDAYKVNLGEFFLQIQLQIRQSNSHGWLSEHQCMSLAWEPFKGRALGCL